MLHTVGVGGPGIEFKDKFGPKFRTFLSKVTRGLHLTPPSNPRVGTQALTKPEGLVDNTPPCQMPTRLCLLKVS